jgi:hypothetical protein
MVSRVPRRIGLPSQVLLSNGESFVVNTPFRPRRGFFGVTTDVAITSIRFATMPAPLYVRRHLLNFRRADAMIDVSLALITREAATSVIPAE